MNSASDLTSHLINTKIYETCREEMTDHLYLDPIDAADKTRVCYNRYYRLFRTAFQHFEKKQIKEN
jgi:hypothetical protein